jgi:methylthioribose-1-phosphate isomerase
MRVNMFTRAAIVTGAVAGLSMLVAASPASAECKAYQTATAHGLFKGVTGVEARAAWRIAVTGKDGVAYALWSKSKNRSTTCWEQKTGSKWKCVARARPCS